MGMIGINNSNSRTISLKRTDGTVVGTARVTGPGGTKKLKKLQYNFRDISNRVLKSKSSLGAKSVVASARAKVAALYRKRATGDYAEDETRHAIAHAESLVRVAKKKARHLEQEEKLKRHEKAERSRELLEKDREEPSAEEIVQQSEEAARISEEELQKLMKELQELMKEMEQAQELQEAAEAIEEGEMDPEDLELLKKKHRASEMKELVEADLRYLKALFDKLAKEKQEASSGSGTFGNGSAMGYDGGGGAVSLELGGEQIDVPAAELVEMTQGANVDIQA